MILFDDSYPILIAAFIMPLISLNVVTVEVTLGIRLLLILVIFRSQDNKIHFLLRSTFYTFVSECKKRSTSYTQELFAYLLVSFTSHPAITGSQELCRQHFGWPRHSEPCVTFIDCKLNTSQSPLESSSSCTSHLCNRHICCLITISILL